MARSIQEIEQEVRLLGVEDRNRLLRDLIADMDGGSEEDVKQAWSQEAKRRHSELQEGLVEPVLAAEVIRKAKSRVRDGG